MASEVSLTVDHTHISDSLNCSDVAMFNELTESAAFFVTHPP